ncbi:hypothetical protein PHSY_002601 [Pseudozyma hubeiensis SY62]|uniref:Uncharacterized protein n=1 Tax=Pseudozyma hubeiensis (strain SY62) TaxID=1305764 RepID=R9P1C3_PSEHS|nr:hypothetical protein PHSY_002601 [Pseudozyma hubeiensis SY62]GAC95026.1 hypothetical protein PHSY_002601 [Pseudozyma hubeiensis SY62]
MHMREEPCQRREGIVRNSAHDVALTDASEQRIHAKPRHGFIIGLRLVGYAAQRESRAGMAVRARRCAADYGRLFDAIRAIHECFFHVRCRYREHRSVSDISRRSRPDDAPITTSHTPATAA